MSPVAGSETPESPRRSQTPAPPEPDGKDWTWTLERVGGECGFDAGGVGRSAVPALVTDAMSRFSDVLERPGATRRPSARTWSVLEYSCHVRDV